MFDIFIRTHFSSGHHLRNYPGECEKPHGHNWKIEVRVRATRLDELGMGIDFKYLKKKVNPVIDDLDHRDLNEHPAFKTINPSSENIARFLFNTLKEPLKSDRHHLHSIMVRETDPCGVIYRGE